MENQAHKVRDREIGTWLFGALRNGAQQVEGKSGKIDAKEMTNPNREIFQQVCHGKWYGKSLGMAQDQISAKNFRIPPFLQAREGTDSWLCHKNSCTIFCYQAELSPALAGANHYP